MITVLIGKLFAIYIFIIFLRVFLTWVPNLDWYMQPLKFVRDITDPYLNVFQNLIPPIGGLDFSPIIAIMVLYIIQIVITSLLGFLF